MPRAKINDKTNSFTNYKLKRIIHTLALNLHSGADFMTYSHMKHSSLNFICAQFQHAQQKRCLN